MSSTSILHLVDSVPYIEGNCFQHQLLKALRQQDQVQVETCALATLNQAVNVGDRPVICCLKQRTLAASFDALEKHLCRVPVIIYDQDPWEAFRDGSPYKGTYERAMERLNVKAFAVTTQLWADFLFHRKIPAQFVRMWVQPEYCDRGPSYEDRPIHTGFVGTRHSYRQQLFDALDDLGVQVNAQAGGLPYPTFLSQLGSFRVYVHAEDSPVIVDGNEMNLRDALWIKDIEAMARGCFCVRNFGTGHTSYTQNLPRGSDGKRLLRLYKHPSDVPKLLEDIEKMDPLERQSLIDKTVDAIRDQAVWQETARTLVTLATEAT
jgi:hypothetical protein